MMAEPDRPMWKDHAYGRGDIVRDPRTGDEYRVLELIGRGAYAEVYRAEHVRSGSLFALKVLQLHRAVSAKTRERHRREALLLLRLRHPNVVQVHAIIEGADGRIVMVMDLLVGRTLTRLREDCDGKLPINTAIEIAIQVCSAIEAVHDVNVVHRDLKPDNIFVGDDARVRLCDLGVSQFPRENRITTEDTTIGTVEYMSPEQLYAPQSIGPRSDLFALGVVLYEMIAGVSPFAVDGELSGSMKELGMQIVLKPHAPLLVAAPGTPTHLAAIVECLLSKEPGGRYASAAIVRELLDAALSRYLLELAAQKIEPPRISFVGRLPAVAPIDPDQPPMSGGSVNPFVSVSVPPQQPSNDARPADAHVKTEELPTTPAAGMPTAAPDLAPPLHLAPDVIARRGSTVRMSRAGSADAHVNHIEHIAGLPSTVRIPVPVGGTTPAPSPLSPVVMIPSGQRQDAAREPRRQESSSAPAVILPGRDPQPSAPEPLPAPTSIAAQNAPLPAAAWPAPSAMPPAREARIDLAHPPTPTRSRARAMAAVVAAAIAILSGVLLLRLRSFSFSSRDRAEPAASTDPPAVSAEPAASSSTSTEPVVPTPTTASAEPTPPTPTPSARPPVGSVAGRGAPARVPASTPPPTKRREIPAAPRAEAAAPPPPQPAPTAPPARNRLFDTEK